LAIVVAPLFNTIRNIANEVLYGGAVEVFLR
jgi:hypothetical protein